MWAQLEKSRSLRKLKRAVLRAIRGYGYFGEQIEVHCEVEIWNGRTHILSKHNHFVNDGLVMLINMLTTVGTTSTTAAMPAVVAGAYWTLKLGTDTTTITTPSMTNLVTEVATEPNTLSGATANPTLGVVRCSYIGTWNAGTVSGTVGELGLRLGIHTFKTFGWSWAASSAKILASRLSAADGDFIAFVINTGAPLTVEWRVTFTFA